MDTRIKSQQFGIGDIFAEGWRVYRSNWVKISLIALCIYAPLDITSSLLQLDPWMGSLAYNCLGLLAPLAIAFIVEKAIQGHDVTWGDAMRHGLSRWPSAIGTSILEGLILTGLALLFVIPGVIWAVYYTFVVYVVALRNIGGKEALDYSKNLVQGQWWRVVGIWLVIMAVLFGIILIVALPFGIVATASGIQTLEIVPSLLGDLVTALFTVIIVVWFLNIDYLKSRAGAVMERTGLPVPHDLWGRASIEPTVGVEVNISSGYERLADRLKFGPLSLSEAVRTVNVLAEELDREEKVHHNLRPEYIRFDERENPPQIGLAAPDEKVPSAAPDMSPEEVRGGALDGRSDIYSLGAVMYCALTGRPPFEGATDQGVMYKLATEPPRPPRELRPDLPEAINGVLLKALAKRPDDRFQTATEFARAFSAAAERQTALETIQPTGPQAATPISSLAWPLQSEAAPGGAAPPAGEAAAPKSKGLTYHVR